MMLVDDGVLGTPLLAGTTVSHLTRRSDKKASPGRRSIVEVPCRLEQLVVQAAAEWTPHLV